METLKKVKKIVIAVLGIGLMLGATLLSGCVPSEEPATNALFTAEELAIKQSEAYNQGKIDGVNSVNIIADNQDAITGFLDVNEIAYTLAEDGQIVLTPTPIEPVVEPTETLTSSGYDLDELELGETFAVTLNDNDLEKLQDTKIELDGEDYDIHEEFVIGDSAKLVTNGMVGYDVDMGAEPYLTIEDSNDINYRYVFEDAIPFDEISEEDSLKINFLGREREIIGIDDNSIETIEGTFIQLTIGEEKDGIKLLSVAENEQNAVIQVNDVSQVIEKGQTKTFGEIEVYISEIFHGTNNYDYVDLRYGEDIKKTIDNGDEYTEDSDWEWVITTEDDTLKELGVTYNAKLDDFDDEELLTIGDTFSLPEDFITMIFKEVQPTETSTYSFEFEEYEEDLNTLHIEADSEEGILVGTEEVEEVWYDGINTYYKIDGDEYTYEGAPILKNDETEVELGYADSIITLGETGITFKTTDFLYLGETEEDSDEEEFWYNTLDISDREDDTLTTYGIVVKAHQDNDNFEIELPSEQVKATINFV